MKKIYSFLIFIAIVFIVIFFPDQDDYYLTDDLLKPSVEEALWMSIALFIVVATFSFWLYRKEEEWLENLAASSWIGFKFLFIVYVCLFPMFRQGILLINRTYSSETLVKKEVVFRRYGVRMPDVTSENKDTIYVRFREKLPLFYNEERTGKDSVVIQFEKGLFGYYYINKEKTKIIPSK